MFVYFSHTFPVVKCVIASCSSLWWATNLRNHCWLTDCSYPLLFSLGWRWLYQRTFIIDFSQRFKDLNIICQYVAHCYYSARYWIPSSSGKVVKLNQTSVVELIEITSCCYSFIHCSRVMKAVFFISFRLEGGVSVVFYTVWGQCPLGPRTLAIWQASWRHRTHTHVNAPCSCASMFGSSECCIFLFLSWFKTFSRKKSVKTRYGPCFSFLSSSRVAVYYLFSHSVT